MVDTRGLTGNFNNPFTPYARELRETDEFDGETREELLASIEAAIEERNKWYIYTDKHGTTHIGRRK